MRTQLVLLTAARLSHMAQEQQATRLRSHPAQTHAIAIGIFDMYMSTYCHTLPAEEQRIQ